MGEIDYSEIDVSDINIPGVDAEGGSALYGEEMDIYVPVLQSFVDNIPAAVDKLRVVSEANLKEYATAVHGLKGSCAGIGAEAVRAMALDLETKSKAGDLSGVLAQNAALIERTEKLIKDIGAWLGGLQGS